MRVAESCYAYDFENTMTPRKPGGFVSEKMLFLPRDMRRLEAAMADHERRYKEGLGGVGDAVDVSSETWHDKKR